MFCYLNTHLFLALGFVLYEKGLNEKCQVSFAVICICSLGITLKNDVNMTEKLAYRLCLTYYHKMANRFQVVFSVKITFL